MGVNLHLVDAIYPCSEGWELSFLAALIMHAATGAQTPLLEESYV